jgi:flavin-dependent dehydrogenase
VYDVIVVGARCAGSPTAMLLARKGHRVLVLDRARFPSDTFRNHFVRLPAARALARWGLLNRVFATNCPPIRKRTMDFGDFPLAGFPPGIDDVPGELAPRRIVLDAILVEAAVEAGAELREGVVVEDLLWNDGRVVGVRGRDGGQASEERASVVIGADGQRSLVAQKVGAEVRQATPPLTFGYYSYWENTGVDGLEVVFRTEQGRALIAFPTNDGLACIAVQGVTHDFPSFQADIEAEYWRAIDLAPYLAERMRAGRRAERFQGTPDLPNVMRAAAGPGWALVGDAGYHLDPLPAQGIMDAFRDAENLAEAVDRGLTGAAPMDAALTEYERKRDEVAVPIFESTVQQCALGPFPEDFLELRAALRASGSQDDIDRLYGVDMETVSRDEFYAPENMERMMAAGRA